MDSPQVKITFLNFSVSPPDDPNSLQAVKTKIQQLDTQFDFVLLAEFFDESLVTAFFVPAANLVSPKNPGDSGQGALLGAQRAQIPQAQCKEREQSEDDKSD